MIPDSVPPVVVAAFAIAALAVVLAVVQSLSMIDRRLFAAPGVVVHEFAHEQVCRLVGVPVTDVAYFRFGDPPGYVKHGRPGRYRESFAIGVAPFLVNSVVSVAVFVGLIPLVSSMGLVDAVVGTEGALATLEAVRDALAAAPSASLALAALLGWFGFSIGLQAFPSTGDAQRSGRARARSGADRRSSSSESRSSS